jgi:hypothetical protein
MGPQNPKLLSELTDSQLEAEAKGHSIPKWNSLCLMKLLDLPTLDAAFIPPTSSKELIEETTCRFSERLGINHVLIRSDGGKETKEYFRGGNTLPLRQASELTYKLSSLNRAVLLMEPTDRFCNQLSVNSLLSIEGTYHVEILGPGYDVSDLNRGGILPQYTISCSGISWRQFETPRAFDIRTTEVTLMNDSARRLKRITNIASNILPSIDILIEGEPTAFAETWLREKGYNHLWEPWHCSFNLRKIRRWFEEAYLVANWMLEYCSWRSLALSASELGDGRFIYWDVVNASHKYGR